MIRPAISRLGLRLPAARLFTTARASRAEAVPVPAPTVVDVGTVKVKRPIGAVRGGYVTPTTTLTYREEPQLMQKSLAISQHFWFPARVLARSVVCVVSFARGVQACVGAAASQRGRATDQHTKSETRF